MKIFRCRRDSVRARRSRDRSSGPADDASCSRRTRTATPVHVYRVAFEPGGRTNWHTHSGPQWLFIVEDASACRRWGEPPQDVERRRCGGVRAGREALARRGARRRAASHLAVNVNVETEWLEPVTDEQYQGRSRAKLARSIARLAGVAQLVEQLIRNQQVTGSSRVAGSSIL